MAQKMDLPLQLERRQLDWLNAMTNKYNLPSVGKALRICILYTKLADEDAAISAKSRSFNSNDLMKSRHQLDGVHDRYLQDLVMKYGLGSKDKATRLLLDYVMSAGNEATIFKVVRCKNCYNF